MSDDMAKDFDLLKKSHDRLLKEHAALVKRVDEIEKGIAADKAAIAKAARNIRRG